MAGVLTRTPDTLFLLFRGISKISKILRDLRCLLNLTTKWQTFRCIEILSKLPKYVPCHAGLQICGSRYLPRSFPPTSFDETTISRSLEMPPSLQFVTAQLIYEGNSESLSANFLTLPYFTLSVFGLSFCIGARFKRHSVLSVCNVQRGRQTRKSWRVTT